jgi:hypothetical protein
MTALEKIGIEKFNETVELFFKHNPDSLNYIGELSIEYFYFKKSKGFLFKTNERTLSSDELIAIAFSMGKDGKSKDFIQKVIYMSGFLETLNVNCKK